MQISDTGLSRPEELSGRHVDALPAVLVWAAVGGIIVWALAIWKLLEILHLAS